MLHQVGVSFDLYYDARKRKIKILQEHNFEPTLNFNFYGKKEQKRKNLPSSRSYDIFLVLIRIFVTCIEPSSVLFTSRKLKKTVRVLRGFGGL